MAFDHHKLDVYARSLTLLDACDQGEASELAVTGALQHLQDVVCMLVKLIRSCER